MGEKEDGACKAYLQRPGSHHRAHQVYTNSEEIAGRRRDWLRKENLVYSIRPLQPICKDDLGVDSGEEPMQGQSALHGLTEPLLTDYVSRTALHPGWTRPRYWGGGVPRGRQIVLSQAHEEGHTSVPIIYLL